MIMAKTMPASIIRTKRNPMKSFWNFATPNKNRMEGPIMENHFGLLSVNFEQDDPFVLTEIWDIRSNQYVEFSILLSEISFH